LIKTVLGKGDLSPPDPGEEDSVGALQYLVAALRLIEMIAVAKNQVGPAIAAGLTIVLIQLVAARGIE
jgi:hypothetical protein